MLCRYGVYTCVVRFLCKSRDERVYSMWCIALCGGAMHRRTLVKGAVAHHAAHLLPIITAIVSIKSTTISTNVIGDDVSTCASPTLQL